MSRTDAPDATVTEGLDTGGADGGASSELVAAIAAVEVGDEVRIGSSSHEWQTPMTVVDADPTVRWLPAAPAEPAGPSPDSRRGWVTRRLLLRTANDAYYGVRLDTGREDLDPPAGVHLTDTDTVPDGEEPTVAALGRRWAPLVRFGDWLAYRDDEGEVEDDAGADFREVFDEALLHSDRSGSLKRLHVPRPDDEMVAICGLDEEQVDEWGSRLRSKSLDVIPDGHVRTCPGCLGRLADAYGVEVDPRTAPSRWPPEERTDEAALGGAACAACGEAASGRVGGVPLCDEWCERDHFSLSESEQLVSDLLPRNISITEIEAAVEEAGTVFEAQRETRISHRGRLTGLLNKLGLSVEGNYAEVAAAAKQALDDRADAPDGEEDGGTWQKYSRRGPDGADNGRADP